MVRAPAGTASGARRAASAAAVARPLTAKWGPAGGPGTPAAAAAVAGWVAAVAAATEPPPVVVVPPPGYTCRVAPRLVPSMGKAGWTLPPAAPPPPVVAADAHVGGGVWGNGGAVTALGVQETATAATDGDVSGVGGGGGGGRPRNLR